MMVIAALGLEVQSNAQGLRERTEEVFDHFGRQISDMAVLELGDVIGIRINDKVKAEQRAAKAEKRAAKLIEWDYVRISG